MTKEAGLPTSQCVTTLALDPFCCLGQSSEDDDVDDDGSDNFEEE